ncbi:MAG TPA: hypothetical protein EYO99_01080 [Candidatus Marinimicrobia bacterium]|jgi:hypothetical protein|nr:hypothetical protein [Candidatus Neomarinimicrobiota bacterium]
MSTILELFIPIIAVSTLPIIVYFIVKKKMHDRKLLSKEILAAIEKGIDVPIMPRNISTPLDYLRRGIICTLIGLFVGITFAGKGDIEAAAILGSVPFAVGIGYLIYYKLATKEEEK